VESSLIVNNGKTQDSSAELTQLPLILVPAEFLPGVRYRRQSPFFCNYPPWANSEQKHTTTLRGKKSPQQTGTRRGRKKGEKK